MTRLLITRPEPQAERTARELEAAGFEVVRAPMLEVAYHSGSAAKLTAALAAGAPQALLITSQHAAQVLNEVPAATAFPILTVGPASYEAAREAGAKNVKAADGDAASLLALIRRECSPDGAAILYLRAADIAADLAGTLRQESYAIVEILTYEAQAVSRIPDPAAQGLLHGTIDGVLFYSARTADIFLEAAAGQGLMPCLQDIRAVVAGETIAGSIRRAGWKKVTVLKLTDPATAASALKALFAEEEAATPEMIPPTIAEAAKPVTHPDPVRPRPASPPRQTAPRRTGLRWEIGLLIAGVVVGLVATGQYFYHQRTTKLAAAVSKPSDYHFMTRATMPHIEREARAPEAEGEQASGGENGGLANQEPKDLGSPRKSERVTNSSPALSSQDVTRPSLNESAIPGPASESGQALTPPPPSPAADAMTGQTLDAMQHQLDAQEARLEAVEQQLSQANLAVASEGGKRQALGQLIALRSALASGKAYKEALSELLLDEELPEEVAGLLGSLEAKAGQGIATPKQLQDIFAACLKEKDAVVAKPGFWNGLKTRLGSVVTVRKIGADHLGDDEGSVIARAEAALQDEQIDRSLQELSFLSKNAAGHFVPYRDAARARLKAFAALDQATALLSIPPAPAEGDE